MMYEEDSNVKFNWKGFLLKLLIALLIIFLILKLLPFKSKKEANGHTKVFNDNFSSIKNVGSSYFTKDNLPTNDEEVKVSLRQLINSKKIKTLKGADNKVCNEDDSFIKTYKKNIGYELEVHLVCGDEEETSYVYLGCYDNCEIKSTTTTTTTTTTTKKTTTKKANSNSSSSNNQSNSSSSSSSSKTTKTTTKTTTTTTRVKKYAVIFNENGGTKFSTQFVVAGSKAINPGNSSKVGYTFEGWYLNGEKYDFDKPVTENIILIAKWKVNDLIGLNDTQTTKAKQYYNQIVYSANVSSMNSLTADNINLLSIPKDLDGKNNIKVSKISYVRNFTSNSDVTNYLNTNAKYDNYNFASTTNITNFGSLDNLEISQYGSETDRLIYWNGRVNNKCTSPLNNSCAYGIIYRVTWEYTD